MAASHELQCNEEGSSSTQSNDNAVHLAAGAPVEKNNPLGHEVTLLSSIMLNIGEMLGSGIFSLSGVLLDSVGSVGLLFVFWILAPIFAVGGLMVYTEFASLYPNRSGAEVVFLEKAYPRPRFLVPVTFAVTTVLLSYSAINSIVFAQYVLAVFSIPITPSNQAGLAVTVCTVCIAVVAISTKWSLRVVNVLTSLKVLSLVFLVGTGFFVLIGATRVKDPYANYHDIFEGSTSNINSLATALMKTSYAFLGWQNAFNVLNEVRGPDPVKTVRRAGFISLLITALLFVFTNVAYIAAVPKEEIKNSGQLIAALFVRKVYGDTFGAKLLPLMVALSCVGSIIAGAVGQARMLREIARQGILPYPEFFASTRPFGTPLGPVALKYFLTVFIILALPAEDAYNFLVDLASYPGLVFHAAATVGLWLVRKRRILEGLPPAFYQAKNTYVLLYLASIILLLVMPWVPPESGHGDVSFWYATYCVVGLGILALCGVYYYFWVVLLPRLGGYKIVEEIEQLPDGAMTAKLVRRYNASTPTNSERQPLITS